MRKVDGLLIIGGDIDASELQSYKTRLPRIVAARDINVFEEQCVSVNNKPIGYLEIKSLSELGHT